MSATKKRNSLKTLLILAGAIGVGAIGVSIYKKNKVNNYRKIDLDLFSKELTEILVTDCNYIYKLVNEEAEIIKDGSLNNIFELESLKMVQDLYYKSRNFEFDETKELAKNMYIFNIKLIEGYLGRLSDDEIVKSAKKLAKTIDKILTISLANDLDDLYNNHCVNEAIINTHMALEEKLSKNCTFTKHLLKYNELIEL